MNVRRDVFEIQHHVVAPHECPEIVTVPVASAVQHVETEARLIEVDCTLQIVNDEEGCDAV
jgi:hypothetical protein